MKRRVHSEAIITYTYDNGGRVLSQTQADTTNPANLVILSKNLSQYDRYGDRLFTALDVNRNGVIDVAGLDRVTAHTTSYIVKDDALWQESTQSVYPDFDSDSAVVTAKSRRKLTNLGAFATVTEAEDIRGNVTTATQTVDPATGTTVSSTTIPTSIQPQLQIQRYGQLVESVSTTAVTNRYAYDGLNRQVAVTDGRGNTSATAYNTFGQVVYEEDAATNRTSYVYDQFGRQVETIDALNQSTHTVYDLRGSVVKQYGATYPVWYEYDTEGRMVAMATTRDTTLDPATVDTLDHPSLDVTRWSYDPATGLLVQKLYDDGKGPSYTYTPDGKLATRTWARGMVTEYGYDALGQLVGIDYSDSTPDVSYTYDRLDRVLTVVDVLGTRTNVYAAATLSLVEEHLPDGTILSRSTDAFGRPSGLSLGDDYSVSYSYDAYGRFAAVSSAVGSASSVANYAYVPGSHLMAGYTLDGLTRVVSYEPLRSLIIAVTNSFNDQLISAFDYANDVIGRSTARLDSRLDGVVIPNAFGYNARSEVTSANIGTNAYGYVFDPIGNRISTINNVDVTSYAANTLNQYTAISNAVVTLPIHDDDGNMTSTGDGWHYAWNGENRLVLASNATHVASYAYDYQGRMVWKKISRGGADAQSWEEKKTTSYLWDDFNIIAETSEETETTNTTYNVWGINIDGTMRGAGGVGGLLAVVKDNAMSYFPCYDGNGSITEYVLENGYTVAHREYDPFGGTIEASGAANDLTHWFSTKPWCSITALSEYQYRMYRPVLGRWLNRDPIEESGGLMLYAFANNHYGSSDLLGLCNCGEMKTEVVDKGDERTCYENWRAAFSDMAPIGFPMFTYLAAAGFIIVTGAAAGAALGITGLVTSGTISAANVVAGVGTAVSIGVDVQLMVQSVTVQATGHEYRNSICQDYECVSHKYWFNTWEESGLSYRCMTNHRTFSVSETHSDLIWCAVKGWYAVGGAGTPTACWGVELQQKYGKNPKPCDNSLNYPGPHYKDDK